MHINEKHDKIFYSSILYYVGNRRGGRAGILRFYCAGELYLLIIFDVTLINLNKDLLGFVVLYPVSLSSAIKYHNNNIMKIKLTHNICFVYKSRG